jgi:hypothetical protein
VINSNALEDLDAIYFLEKIDMRAHSTMHKHIPKLDLQLVNHKKEKIIPVTIKFT